MGWSAHTFHCFLSLFFVLFIFFYLILFWRRSFIGTRQNQLSNCVCDILTVWESTDTESVDVVEAVDVFVVIGTNCRTFTIWSEKKKIVKRFTIVCTMPAIASFTILRIARPLSTIFPSIAIFVAFFSSITACARLTHTTSDGKQKWMKWQKSIVRLQLTKLRNSMLLPMSFVAVDLVRRLRCHRQQWGMHIAHCNSFSLRFSIDLPLFLVVSMFTYVSQIVAHMRARKEASKRKANKIQSNRILLCLLSLACTIDTNRIIHSVLLTPLTGSRCAISHRKPLTKWILHSMKLKEIQLVSGLDEIDILNEPICHRMPVNGSTHAKGADIDFE